MPKGCKLPKASFKYEKYDEEGFEDDGTTARLMEVMLFPKDTDFKVVWSKNNFNSEPSFTTLPNPRLN